MFAREELLASLPWPKLDPAPDEAPENAETGTQNHEGIAGIGATVEFIASLSGSDGSLRTRLEQSYAMLHDEGERFARLMVDGLSQSKRVRIYGSFPRTPTIGFTVDGMTAEEVARALVRDNLYLSHGDFYAATIIERLGVEALARAGCACYTTEEEVRKLVEAVLKL
jgi:selenocysteine lyase/cysteine desulfurase